MKQPREIKAVYDRVFKTIFTAKEDSYMLETLLKDILKREVVIKEYNNQELEIDKVNSKGQTVDILLNLIEEETIHIEVNTSISQAIKFRNLVYFCKIIASDQVKGEEYKFNKKYISINLVCGLKGGEVVEEAKIKIGKNKTYYENIRIYIVNLDKAREMCIKEKASEEIKHIGALTMTRSEIKKYGKGDVFMEKLNKKMYEMCSTDFWFTPEEDAIMLKKALQKEAELNAMEKGRKKWIKEGMREGAEKQQNKIISNMLKDGLSIEKISKYTDLSKNEILKLT